MADDNEAEEPPVIERVRLGLVERGHAGAVLYGRPEDPAMDVGTVPVEDAWGAYRDALGFDAVPCLYCYAWGFGEHCLSGGCRDPQLA